jgi:hypothetical protein
MWRTRTLASGVLAAALVCAFATGAVAQTTTTRWTPPLTSWGDPDLTGRWPVTHLNGTPVQRPAEFGDRPELTDQEFAARLKQIELTRERTAGAWAEIGGFEGAGHPQVGENVAQAIASRGRGTLHAPPPASCA